MDKWQDLSEGGVQPGDSSLSCGKRGKREDACLQRKQGGGGECLEGFSVSGSFLLKHNYLVGRYHYSLVTEIGAWEVKS